MTRHARAVAVLLCAIAALGAIALSGCGRPGASAVSSVPAGKPQLVAAKDQPIGNLPDAINAFGVDLLRATPNAEGGNVVVSPASVHAALSMTVNGATGETADQMRKVLRIDAIAPEKANAAWASLLTGLADRSPKQKLEVADALWARKGVAFKEPFMTADRDYFGAQLSTLDFVNDDVPGAINSWVSKQTHGMITKIVEEIPPDAILYLGNAVYFKGDWITPFEHQRTGQQPFTRADGSKVSVEMMHTNGQMSYAYNDSLQATRLLYEGNESAYYVLLPRPGVSMDAAMKSLQSGGFAKLRADMQSMVSTHVVLALPKLDTDFGTKLKEPLSKMGMPRAFDDQLAQFDAMADPAQFGGPIYIGEVFHKTKVKVDETGTEAAAATVVEMVAGGLPEPPKAEIICDRPYLFAIVDEPSGAILFLGALNDPTK